MFKIFYLCISSSIRVIYTYARNYSILYIIYIIYIILYIIPCYQRAVLILCQKLISVEGDGHCYHRPSSNWETLLPLLSAFQGTIKVGGFEKVWELNSRDG